MPGPGNVGERVRNLRLTRRLSQAQLAGHDLSDSYISLIESGKRTPTPTVLRLLAERLGCTPEFLADGIEPQQRAHLEVRERQAELMLLGGDAAGALAEFDEVIDRTDDPELSVRAEWGRARALETLGRIEEAIRGFESLREQAEREPGRYSRLPAIIALARSYHAVGDLGQAISLGERALEHLHRFGLTVGREHTELGRVLLLAYVDRGEPARAHGLGRQLLLDAEPDAASPDGASVAVAYQQAAALALTEGTVGDALYFAERAIAVYGEEDHPRARARLRVAGARALLRGVPPYAGIGTGTSTSATRTGEGATDASAATEALGLLRAAAPMLGGSEAIECTLEIARALILVGSFGEAVETAQALVVRMEHLGTEARAEDDGSSAESRGEQSHDPLGAGGSTEAGSADGSHGAGHDHNGGLPVRGSAGGDTRLEAIQAWLIIARALLGQSDLPGARAILSATAVRLSGLELNRPIAQLFRELGELCEAAGDINAATTAYRHALEAAGLRPATRPETAVRDLADC